MAENVFQPSFGNMPERIVGRDEEIALVEKGLTAQPGSRDRAMLIVGRQATRRVTGHARRA